MAIFISPKYRELLQKNYKQQRKFTIIYQKFLYNINIHFFILGKIMFNTVKSDPLDLLLLSIGLRLSYLAKSGDAKFKSLLENRNFSIQLGSEAEQVYRTFSVNDGYFTQTSDKIAEPNLTITFKDSMTGVKLLTKADATAFMVGIQNGDLKMAGDYALLMWFNQVAKFIVPKVPEKLQPIVEQAKPVLEKAKPFAKDLFAKASDFFAEKKAEFSKTVENESKIVDDLKEKVGEIKEKAEEKVSEIKEKAEEIKHSAEEKIDELKHQVEDKIEEGKEKLAETDKQLDAMDGETKENQVKTDNNEDSTPAQVQSQALAEKHADDEIIAENVETDAVNNDNSPITNITVTRNT